MKSGIKNKYKSIGPLVVGVVGGSGTRMVASSQWNCLKIERTAGKG